MSRQWLKAGVIVATLVVVACKGKSSTPSAPVDDKVAPGDVEASMPKRIEDPKLRPTFLPIPAGKFHFGCEPQDTMCQDNEKPVQEVSQPAFHMTKTEISGEQYAVCVLAGKCPEQNQGSGSICNWHGAGRERHPMNCISYASAKAYCEWLGARLPTPEEWEYAAKGGESRVYPWGNQPPDLSLAQMGSNSTSEVGSVPAGASKFGLLDMSGNVWEWTTGTFEGGWMEVRGGAWRNPANSPVLRTSHRGRRNPNDPADFIGFRCVY